jgi:hypothetical protein
MAGVVHRYEACARYKRDDLPTDDWRPQEIVGTGSDQHGRAD